MAEKKSPPTLDGVQKPISAKRILFQKALEDKGFNENVIDLAFEKFAVKHNDNIYFMHINYQFNKQEIYGYDGYNLKKLISICQNLTNKLNQNNQQQQNDNQQPQKHEQKSSPTPGGYKKPIFREVLKEQGFSDDTIDDAIEIYEVKHNDNIQR